MTKSLIREGGEQPRHFEYASDELDAMAGARNYYKWIVKHYRPHLGERVIEVGAGIGTFSSLLRAEPVVRELTLIEPAANNVALLRERFAHDPHVRVRHGYLEDLPAEGQADAIVLVNVLEHVEDDVGLLRHARASLAPGGALLLFVPAIPAIFGCIDRAFEHHRRYSRDSLLEQVGQGGFAVLESRYVNLPGIVPWFIGGRLLRRRSLDPVAVALYDKWVVPWVFALEERIAPPIGQNLLVIATASSAS